MLSRLLSNDEAWRALPPAKRGGGGALPAWARMLAGGLPRTTAAFLLLDRAHRTCGPVPLPLRSAMRWVSAQANRCESGQKLAAADACRAGLDQAALVALERDEWGDLSEAERAALTFARKMTLDSDGVTDHEFAVLVDHFGAEQVASMVLHVAYANFHDRLLLCLGEPGEADGPLPPLDVEFADDALFSSTAPPTRTGTAKQRVSQTEPVQRNPNWSSISYDALQQRLETQRQQPTRLPVPSWSEVVSRLPAELMQKPNAIVWYHVCMGYAPELAVPFEIFMRTAMGESSGKWDRIFGQGLFWVTTRAVHCPYCMGHCEMNWEVAGLSRDEISERSRLLASDDWSSLPPAEQHALTFARTLAQTPWQVTADDMARLVQNFGRETALIIVLNACRYHYMTRISNGFQLTLERENVFFDYYNVKPQSSR